LEKARKEVIHLDDDDDLIYSRRKTSRSPKKRKLWDWHQETKKSPKLPNRSTPKQPQSSSIPERQPFETSVLIGEGPDLPWEPCYPVLEVWIEIGGFPAPAPAPPPPTTTTTTTTTPQPNQSLVVVERLRSPPLSLSSTGTPPTQHSTSGLGEADVEKEEDYHRNESKMRTLLKTEPLLLHEYVQLHIRPLYSPADRDELRRRAMMYLPSSLPSSVQSLFGCFKANSF